METLDIKDLKFSNVELEKTINLLIDNGFNIYVSSGKSKDINNESISYCHYEKGEKLAYLQADYSGVKISTVHKSREGFGFGTGFGISENSECDLTIKDLERGFIFAPNWAKGDLSVVTKYKGIEDYISRPINQILKMYEVIKS